MKKTIAILLSIALLVLWSGCAKQPDPEDSVTSFFESAKILDLQTMYTLVRPEALEAMGEFEELPTQEEMEAEIPESSRFIWDYFKASAQKLTYTITGSEVDGDTASVNVDISYVDSVPVLQAAIGEMFMKAFSLAFSGEEMTEEESTKLMEDIFKDKMETMEETMVDASIQVNLTKIDGVWYISTIHDDLFNAISFGLYSAEEMLEGLFNMQVEE